VKKLLLALLASLLLVVPTFAQTAPATPLTPDRVWAHLTEEFVLQGTFQRNVNNDIAGTVQAGWLHYVTDNTAIGTLVGYTRDTASDATGESAGAWYEYNLPNLKKGHLFLGGDASYLMGDLNDMASASTAMRFGYKLHVGDSSALRVSIEQQYPVLGTEGASGEPLKRTLFVVGFSMGVPQGAPVQ